MDPFSLTVGIAGLVALADGLAKKGYQYLRAAQNCEENVKQLLAELDLLGGVLRRLQQWAEDEEKMDGSENNLPIEIDYIDECQNTLREIRDILLRFEKQAKSIDAGSAALRKSTSAISSTALNGTIPDKAPKRSNLFQRLSRNDLKWPLSKSKTTELINQLERHKATCILAFSAGTASDTNRILGQQIKANIQLAEQGTNLKKVLEMTLAEKHGESAKRILEWYSPVDPLAYHQAARTIYHRGTGRWFVNGPEFLEWQETANSALWFYGIPGAGKTVLSSLVIEETFNLKTTLKASGIAYYYCTFRDAATQKPSHIMGSFVRQLAEQNENAFSVCMSFHAKHHPEGRPPSLPTEAETGELLQEMSQHFTEVSLILDGLDECGSAAGIDRMELTRVLSGLHEPLKGTIRIAIASRKEQDIASFLGSFTSISIAAMSSDLELYIEAEVASRGRGKIRDSDLRDEIIDVLSSGAEGMFQWVKCQLDYLFMLPNDVERRKALKSLPPDLPQTYIRILERLDRDQSLPTQRLIRRVLVWLAFESNGNAGWLDSLNLQSIAIAVSIDVGCDATRPSPPPPLPSDIASCCSSLVIVDEARNSIKFSHFSVKEFLVTSPDEVSSPVARKYLLQESRDKPYMAEVCLAHLTSRDLPPLIDWHDEAALADFGRKFPFYHHAAAAFWVYLEFSDAAAEESVSSRRFFTPLANCSFTFWQQYVICYESGYRKSDVADFRVTWSPLYLAASCKLVKTVLRMVSEGGDVNAGRDGQMLPLHCSLLPSFNPLRDDGLSLNTTEYYEEDPKGSLPMVKALISHGAEVNRCVEAYDIQTGIKFSVDPCAVVFWANNLSACSFILENGVRINPDNFNKMLDVLELNRDGDLSGYGSMLDLVLSGNYIQDSALRQRLNQFRNAILQNEHESNQDVPTDSHDLILAVRYGNEAAFERLLETSINIEMRDSDGKTALYLAVENFHHSFASALLKKGADVRALNDQEVSPLRLAYETWELSDLRAVFESTNCLRLTPVEASQIVQQACKNSDDEILSYFLAHWDHPQLAIDLPVDFTATPAVLQVLYEHALLDPSLTLSTILAACKDGHDVILSEVLARCTAAEIDEFRLAALNEDLPYHRQVLRVLLENDLAVFSKDVRLLTACDYGHHDMVELLLASGASANFLGIEGSRPVHYAAWHLDILQTLKSRGANLAYRNRRGETSLHLASARGALDCVKWLLEHGVSIDSKTAHGHVALHDAAQAGHDLVCQHLLESGADFRIHTRHTGSTPLHYAANYGHLQVVKTLLNFDNDLLARDAWGGTPLHTAALVGHVEVVEMILEAVTLKDYRIIDTDGSGSAAGEVLLPNENGKIDEVPLGRRSYVNLQNTDGDTALMHAVEGGHVGVLAALLQEGGNLKIANSKGNLPLHTAAAVNHTAILTLLAQSAPMVDALNYDGNTALHLAAEKSNIAAIQVILDLTPDLTIVNHCFMTVLEVVQKHQNEGWELCQELLRDAGSKASDRASEQHMALDEDLLKTIDQIKLHLIHRQDLYGLFLGTLRRNPSCAINITYVVKELSTLFQNNGDQIEGINKLLPPGYKIACSTYDDSNSTEAKHLSPGTAQQLRSTYEHVSIDRLSSEQLPSGQVPTEQLSSEQIPTEQDTNHLALKELASLVKSWPTRLAIRGIHEEAEEVYRAVIQSQEAVLETDSPGMLATIYNLTYLLCLRIEPQDAEALLRQVLLTGETLIQPF